MKGYIATTALIVVTGMFLAGPASAMPHWSDYGRGVETTQNNPTAFNAQVDPAAPKAQPDSSHPHRKHHK